MQAQKRLTEMSSQSSGVIPVISTSQMADVLDWNFTLLKNGQKRKLGLLFYGSPGIGKTEIIKKKALEHGFPVIVIQLSAYRPSDLAGVPVPDLNNKKLEWYPPDFMEWADFPKVEVKAEVKEVLEPEHKKDWDAVVYFFDELNTVPPSVQGVALRMILEKRIGHVRLHENSFIIAACNPPNEVTHASKLTPALLNRFAVYKVVPDPDSWIEWAIENNIHPYVFSFIKSNPNMLYRRSDFEYEGSFLVTPRSWEEVSNILKGAELQGRSIKDILIRIDIAAVISDPIAKLFFAFISQLKDLPSAEDYFLGKVRSDEILENLRDKDGDINNGKTIFWISSLSQSYVKLMKVMESDNERKKLANMWWDFIKKLPEELKLFAVKTMKLYDHSNYRKYFGEIEEFRKWAKELFDLLFNFEDHNPKQ